MKAQRKLNNLMWRLQICAFQIKKVLLMGDFNVRTHNKHNFMDEDEFLCRQFDYDKDLLDHFQNSAILDQYNLPKVCIPKIKLLIMRGTCSLIYPT